MNNRERLREVANGVPAPRDLSPERFEAEDFERVRESLFMAVVAEAIPRRLGANASPSDLALDKRISRKIANMYRTLWAATDPQDAPRWSSRGERTGLANEAERPARKAGATVSWPRWIKERVAELGERRAAVAAYALEIGRPRWGVRRLRLIETELDNLKRIANEAITIERRSRERSSSS